MNALLRGPRAATLLAVLLASACVLAACGGKSAGSSTPSSPASSSAAGGGGGAAAAGFGRPAASGQIAAISGSTMQVQSPQSGQVAVSWTAATKFTDTVATTLAAVRPGDCVTATAVSAASSSTSPASASSSSATSSTSPLAATVLMVTQPVNGQCGGGLRGGAGGGRTGFPTGTPTRSRPSGAPTGGFARRTGDFATGTVSSVSGSTVVVAAQQFGSTSTTDRSVTVSAQTKITTTQASTSGALKVGRCVTAQGNTDSTGAVTATTVRVTDPVNGQCAAGFGGGFGGGGAGGGNNGGGTGG